jgi:hypothetical protein
MEAILEKLRLIKENPGYFKGLSPEEQAELFLLLLTPKKKVFQKPKIIEGINGKDGVTPEKDKDYLSREASLAVLNDIRTEVQKTLASIKPIKGENGKDAEITPELIESIVSEAVSRVPIPRFPIETTQMVVQAQDDIAFIKEELERLEEELQKKQKSPIFGGGIGKATVLQMIQDYSVAGSKHIIQDEGTPRTARTNLNFTGSGVTVTDDAGNDATVVHITEGSGATAWGDITGTLSNQTDLQTILDGLVPYTGATGDVDLGINNFASNDITMQGFMKFGNDIDNVRINREGPNLYRFDGVNTSVPSPGGILDFSALTLDRTYEYPDKSGTLATLDDIPATSSLQDVTDVGSTTNNDIEITDTAKGVIIKSANGTRWRIGITNNGELTAVSL